MAQTAAPSDRDLASIAQARSLVRRAKEVAPVLAEFSQQQIDRIVDAMAAAVTPQAEALARLAHEETGYGLVEDKIRKNLFASDKIYNFIKPMKTVGVIRRLEDKKVVEIAEPFGVVAAICPTTNPTSTAIYKILIAIKARCPIVISPHPSAVRCISRSADIMNEAALRAGLPAGAIGCMTEVTLEGTQELMKARETAVILATGGMGLVRAAYSAGKPAYGVGPGNAPAYIERSADVAKAVRDIVTGKTFDNGLLCSSENSVVVDAPLVEEVKRQFVANGAHFLSPAEIDKLGRELVTPQRLPNPKFVGRTAMYIAQQVGIPVAPGTRVLIAELAGVGRDYPLSIEKLCPVLSFYVVNDWKEGCERCKQILRYGGMGHTMSIHSRNEEVILEFGLKKPAFRIVVNTPTTLGSIGLTTSLDPSMTLGCGGWGGNITSDNISPRHLLNIKRLAYETSPAPRSASLPAPGSERRADAPPERRGDGLPKAPEAPKAAGIAAESLARRIDQFLASRGYAPPAAAAPKGVAAPVEPPPPAAAPTAPAAAATPAPGARRDPAAEFVCEDDVRQAVRQGRKIVIGERTIVTPAARDLAEQHRVFVQADWRP
ncbi:MAG TPA: aldehyde dehydrogenase family protein [Vicinamibacterales bacterium]|nr:aldehyde dehydrogenase family protein [Vicinamibacterales bacterium]